MPNVKLGARFCWLKGLSFKNNFRRFDLKHQEYMCDSCSCQWQFRTWVLNETQLMENPTECCSTQVFLSMWAPFITEHLKSAACSFDFKTWDIYIYLCAASMTISFIHINLEILQQSLFSTVSNFYNWACSLLSAAWFYLQKSILFTSVFFF